MKKIVLIILVYSALVCTAIGQTTIGIPAIKNYTQVDFNASTEIYDAKQDRNGILYFANNLKASSPKVSTRELFSFVVFSGGQAGSVHA